MQAVMESQETLRGYLERKMKQRTMTAQMLSLQSGVAPTTLRQLLEGTTRRIDVRVLKKLAPPLKVSFEMLARVAAGLPADRDEPAEELPPARRKLDDLLNQWPEDSLDDLLSVIQTFQRQAERQAERQNPGASG